MFGLVLQSTYDDMEETKSQYEAEWVKSYEAWTEAEKRIIQLNAELARERNVHTDYWLDSAGRWRHPDKPCKCVSAKVVMAAKLKKEDAEKRARARDAYEQQARQMDVSHGGGLLDCDGLFGNSGDK